MGIRRLTVVTALVGCSFLLLGCGIPIEFSSEGTVTESESKKMVEWCFDNGQVAVSCPQAGPTAAYFVNSLGYDESCVWEYMKFFMRSGINQVVEKCS
jgi:hypothetical protein